jgi:methylmalonyl-CoA mutase N-terminal domain/subunit
VRVAVETMAAVMGGAQSIFTAAFDEATQIPTEFSAELALRTQQIIAYESGISRSVDPLGGSHLVEFLTDRMEAEIEKVMGEIDDYGGVIKAIEEGWLQARLAERALERKINVDEKRTVIVGVNAFQQTGEGATTGEVFRMDPAAAGRVRERFAAVMDRRDNQAVAQSLARLEVAAANDRENLMPYLVDCCHAYATVGEMVACLKKRWGDFQEPIRL